MKHFDNFGKSRKQICEIDDELCHHTEASGWDVRYYLYLPYFIVLLSVSLLPTICSLSLFLSPYSFGHKLKVWPVGPEQNLELEWTKKIIENDSLSSSDGAGVNEYMSFTSMETFNTFWEWLSPN